MGNGEYPHIKWLIFTLLYNSSRARASQGLCLIASKNINPASDYSGKCPEISRLDTAASSYWTWVSLLFPRKPWAIEARLCLRGGQWWLHIGALLGALSGHESRQFPWISASQPLGLSLSPHSKESLMWPQLMVHCSSGDPPQTFVVMCRYELYNQKWGKNSIILAKIGVYQGEFVQRTVSVPWHLVVMKHSACSPCPCLGAMCARVTVAPVFTMLMMKN